MQNVSQMDMIVAYSSSKTHKTNEIFVNAIWTLLREKWVYLNIFITTVIFTFQSVNVNGLYL